MIFRRKIMDRGAGMTIFQTETMKKTTTPKWNELFQVNCEDAEVRPSYPFLSSSSFLLHSLVNLLLPFNSYSALSHVA